MYDQSVYDPSVYGPSVYGIHSRVTKKPHGLDVRRLGEALDCDSLMDQHMAALRAGDAR